jgi:hypothetical protein
VHRLARVARDVHVEVPFRLDGVYLVRCVFSYPLGPLFASGDIP